MEKTKEIRAYLSHQKKLFVLQYVKELKSIAKALKEFKIPKSTFYIWKKSFDKNGANGLFTPLLVFENWTSSSKLFHTNN